MSEKCEIRWCKSGDKNLISSTENISDGAYRVAICRTCFGMFGKELPEPSTVKAKCEEKYKGDDCDICGVEMPYGTYGALVGAHSYCMADLLPIDPPEVSL